MAQFFPRYEFVETRVEITIEGGLFLARSWQSRSMGWKVLFQRADNGAAQKEAAGTGGDKGPDGEDTEQWQARLPRMKKGDPLECVRGELHRSEFAEPMRIIRLKDY